MPVKINGTTSGSVTLAAPATGSDVTLTLPGSAGTVALTTGAGLQFITSQDFSAVSSVSVNNCFSAAYENYRILVNVASPGPGQNINLRMRSGGVDNTSADYIWVQAYVATGLTAWSIFSSAATGDTSALVGRADANRPTGCSFEITCISPFTTAYTHGTSDLRITDVFSANQRSFICPTAYSLEVTTSYDGFTLLAVSGTFSGTVRVYGYRNS